METFRSVCTHVDEYVSEAYGDSPNPYQDEYPSYEKGWDGTVVYQSPRAVGPLMKTDELSPSPSPTRCGSPEQVEVVKGVNKLGNKYTRVVYNDTTNEWWYKNLSGNRYKKNRDGSAVLSRGKFKKYYPAPALDGQVKRKEHDRVDAGDVLPEYPMPSQYAPAARREDIQQPEFVDSTKNGIRVGRERHRKSQPTANRCVSPSPSPSPSNSDSSPPSTSRSLLESQRLKAKRKLKTGRTTKTRNQESAKIRRVF